MKTKIKEKTITKTVYVAQDNQKFDIEEDCVNHNFDLFYSRNKVLWGLHYRLIYINTYQDLELYLNCFSTIEALKYLILLNKTISFDNIKSGKNLNFPLRCIQFENIPNLFELNERYYNSLQDYILSLHRSIFEED